MRKHGCVLALVGFLTSGAAEAQRVAPQPSRTKRGDDVRQFYLNKDSTPAVAAAANARARARSGDCKGALDDFDTAIRYWEEPTLRRDRGLCHEQLGNPYPAIDDYRAYLTGAPQAPDYDQIKARLDALVAQYGEGQPSPQSKGSEATTVGAGGGFEMTYDGRVTTSSGGHVVRDKSGGTRYVAPSDRTAYNSIYAEVGGAGGLWSLNYDRLLGEHVAVRIGFSYVYLSTLSVGSHLVSFPLVVSGLVGAPEHKFEFGIGATPYYASAAISGSTYKVYGTGFSVFGSGVLGYRYQPEDDGVMFRIGFTPLFSDKAFLPWPGLSLGGTF
jgi:hypothetical protein